MFDHFVGLTLNGLKLETYLGICQTSKIVIPFVSVSYSIQMVHEKKSMEKKAREKKKTMGNLLFVWRVETKLITSRIRS